MSNRLCRFSLLHHLWRWFLLISLLASSCLRQPAPVATPTSAAPTKTVIPTQASTPTPNCAPHPAILPTQSASTISSPVEITADGLVQGRVLPSPYAVPTYVRAPIAWTRTTGKGITVGVSQNHDEDLTLVKLVAPDAQVEPLQIDPKMMVAGLPLLDVIKEKGIQILAIVEPSDFELQILQETIPTLIQSGIAVFINSDLGYDKDERDLINELEANGAITVGRLKYGTRIQGRDVFHRQINLFAPYGGETPVNDRGAVLTVAGVGALVLADKPTLVPAALKQQLIATADQMYTGVNPASNTTNPEARSIDPETGDFSATASAFHFRRVNAASAVGLHLSEIWPLNAMNVPAAWKTATGRGVIVGVLDGGFHPDNPIINSRLVGVFPKQAFNEEDKSGFHGHMLAKAVLAVAPDASLMLLNQGDSADRETTRRAEVAAIDYAIQNGVRVLTNSNWAWPNTPEVHAAIDRAIAAGIVFVWSDYTGPNEAVIRAGHFRFPTWEIGAFTAFINEDPPAELEAGLSYSPPQIAGIAALILQNEPELTPMQVKQRILETATVLPNGGTIADAAAAVENHPSGRQLYRETIPAAPDGYLRLEYQSPDSTEPMLIEIVEHRQNWPIASWPRQDILFHRMLPSTLGPYPSTFHLVASRDFNPVLTIEWEGDEATSGDQPARLSLAPDGQWQLYYSIELGTEGIPSLHVEMICDRVRLTWNSSDGAPLERGSDRGDPLVPSDFRLLSFEIETPLMPDLVEPIY